MTYTPWQSQQCLAQLQLDGLHAVANVARLADGLTQVAVARQPLAGARLLGIFAGHSQIASVSAVDHYFRGADWIVSCEHGGEPPLRVDALWRATAPTAADPFLAMVDLIVSVRTHQLDSPAELAVHSVVPADEVVQLPASEGDFATVSPPAATREGRAGCLLFRLPGGNATYVEIVHPADDRRDELCRLPDEPAFRIVHRLFQTRLEKGVLLRARVRGIFVPRSDDLRLAGEYYAAFAAADPPLGT